MNATDVSTAWCGACSLTTDQSMCPRCGAPVDGPLADELRRLSLDHHDAVRRGLVDAARAYAERHAALRVVAASSAPPRAPRRDTEAPSGTGWTQIAAPQAQPPIDPARIITWAGAAMLIAGALAFAGVIWQYAGGPGRMGILAVVTFAAAVGADRLRGRAPVTAEALTAVFAAMIVVDTIAAVVAGYVDRAYVTACTTCVSTAAALLFLVLERHWRSRAARIAAVGFAVVAGSSGAAWLTGFQSGLTGVAAWQVPLGAAVLTAAAYASRDLPRGPERAALLGATWSAWTVFGLTCIANVSYALVTVYWPDDVPSSTTTSLLPSLALMTLVAPPLVVRCRNAVAAGFAGAAGGAMLLVSVMLTLAVTPDTIGNLTLRVVVAGVILAVPVALSVVLVVVLPRRDQSRDSIQRWSAGIARAAAVASISSITVITGVIWQTIAARDLAGSHTAALVVVLPGIALAVAALVLADRVPSDLETAIAVSSLVVGLVALALMADGTVALSAGSVLGIAAGTLTATTAVVRRRALWWALEITAVGALGVALVIGVDEVELWSIPAALVALTLGLAVRSTDETPSSWNTITPACVLALVPSLAVGLAGNHQGLRLSAVSALATVVLLEGARRREKGPTAVAVATLATVLVWMIAPHVHQAPSWTVLVTCGAVLLWIGFTWEARRDSARHTWQRWAQWR